MTVVEGRPAADVLPTHIKNGADHLQSLRDGRRIFVDGRWVEDVTTDPAFARSVASAAALYDFQADPENVELMTFEHSSGRRINRAWQLPTSYEEMVVRRRAITAWSENHFGFMGRSPDHVASALVGQLAGLRTLRDLDETGAERFAAWVEHVRENDAYVSYAIINPQGDRSASTADQPSQELIAGIVDEDSTGVTIRGAKMLGTSAIMSNELFVANLQPLRPGEEQYAVSFGIPIATPGLTLLSRKSYEADAVSEFDNPLSSRFDENDVLVYFDDVHVPWDRVFVHRDVAMAAAQFHRTPGHVYQNYQAQIRLSVKTRFLAGLARAVAETIGTISIPSVAERLGELAALVASVEAGVYGMEAAGHLEDGSWVPNKHFVYASQVVTQELYGQLIGIIRELAGGSLIMLPSSVRDYDDPFISRVIGITQQSSSKTPKQRVATLKLVWDAIGSEYGSRHQQYEMFYAGARFVTRGHSFRSYDWASAQRLVERALAQPE